MKIFLFAFASIALLSTSAFAGAFAAGDFVVDTASASTLSSKSAAVYLQEFSATSSTANLVQSIALPTANAGGNFEFTQGGTATSEGQLTLSPNGQYLALSGYELATGFSSPSSTASSTTSRVVAIVNSSGTVDTSTALTDFSSGNNPRSAITTDGNQIWVAGAAGGVRSTTDGSTTSTLLTGTYANFEQVNIANGQLYASTQKYNLTLATIGSGLPTAGTFTPANLPGLPAISGTVYSYAFADLSGAPGVDTLYIADSSVGIEKFSLQSGLWSQTGSVAISNLYDLTAMQVGSTVDIFATSSGASGASGSIYGFQDSSGFDNTMSGSATLLYTAPANESIKGIAFAPVAVPEPRTWGTAIGGLAMLGLYQRRRNFRISVG